MTRTERRAAAVPRSAPARRRGGWGLAALLLASTACRTKEVPTSELRVALASGISTVDPHAEGTVAALEQLGNVYEPLVTLDGDLRITPCLAVSWANPEPETWVFALRPDVRFHDGTPLGADDVVSSLSRLLGDESLRLRSSLATIAEVSARGASSVVIRTRWPDAQLLASLSQLPIVPEGSSTEALEARPNGTGPYRIQGWEPRRHLSLVRNPGYWGPPPRVERVEVDLGVTPEAARESVLSGRHSLLRFGSAGVLEAAEHSGVYAVVRHPNLYLRHLAFDLARETTPFCPGVPNPFRRPEVREAVSLALDRVSVARRADPAAAVATGLVPPAVFGFDPAVKVPSPDLPRARRLLAEAGYPGGFDVTLHRSGFLEAAEEVKAQLSRVGIRVTVARLESADFFAALNRRELSFWIVANGCVTGDALELLWSAFHSPEPARGLGADNHTGLRSARLDALIEEAARRLDPATRLPHLQGALAAALAENAWIPLYYSADVFVVKKALALRPRADGHLRYAEIGLSR